MPRALEPGLDIAVAVGEDALHGPGEVAVDRDRGCPARHLDKRGVGGDHDGGTARHRLDHGDAEPLVPRRQDERRCTLVQACELGRRDEAADVRPARTQLACERRLLLRPGDDERQADGTGRGERGERVLALLHRTDEEQVAVVPTVARSESRIDAVRCDCHLLRRDPVQLDGVLLRPFRNGEHAVRLAGGARNDVLEDKTVEGPHDARIALEVQVVQGQHRPAAAAERQCVLKMRHVGS